MSPAPTLDTQVQPPPNGDIAHVGQQKSQKQMTRNERRELQDKQRAAKAARQAGAPNGVNGKAPNNVKQGPTPSTSNGAPAQKKGVKPTETPTRPRSQSVNRKDPKTAPTAVPEASPEKARGLRIFAHFGLPKPVSTAKGEIHPAVVRLALQFANFKIVGANARCIATLTAFKTVRNFSAMTARATHATPYRSSKTTPLHRIIPFLDIS